MGPTLHCDTEHVASQLLCLKHPQNIIQYSGSPRMWEKKRKDGELAPIRIEERVLGLAFIRHRQPPEHVLTSSSPLSFYLQPRRSPQPVRRRPSSLVRLVSAHPNFHASVPLPSLLVLCLESDGFTCWCHTGPAGHSQPWRSLAIASRA